MYSMNLKNFKDHQALFIKKKLNLIEELQWQNYQGLKMFLEYQRLHQ
jgi:hypothetical protein